ncbi:MAG: sigma 54-interacting transcriptional regulator [Chthoniobacteraceae bacterium]
MINSQTTDDCPETSCGVVHPSLASADVGACRVIRDLTLLFEISQTLEGSLDIRRVLRHALKQMVHALGLRRGAVTIVNRATQELAVEEVGDNGSTDGGVLGGPRVKELLQWVIDSGKPLTIANVAADEHFEAEETPRTFPAISFLCVPVRSGQRIIGTLSVERASSLGENFDRDLRMLSIIASVIAQAVSLRQQAEERVAELRDENDRLQEQIRNHFKPGNMVGSSSSMQSVYNHIENVANSKTTVLIRGESGVGKELVAHALHNGSPRHGKAFVKVNCAALPESIVESELFGHEKGAFTGAIAMRKGRFELADGGTLFLDEIGDLTPSTQVKLLRVLQEHEFERVGSQTTLKCDVRVIAATSRDLEGLMEENLFRSDLYYRLNVFPIYVPPLRDRKSDMLQLADYFVEKYSTENEKKIQRISTAAIDLMMQYHWPGNVRELQNCIERGVLLCQGDAIQAHHLPPTLQAASPSEKPANGTLETAVAALEHEMIVAALKETHGNMAGAARQLGVSERIMGLRVKRYGVEMDRFKL